MPSFVYTPAELAWAGGEVTLEPVRLEYTAAAMNWGGGSPTIGPNLLSGLTVTKPRLDRLSRDQEISDSQGRVGVQMQALWQKTVESIEAAFNNLTSQVEGIQTALDAANAAQATATAAAATAQATLDAAELANSYTIPVNGVVTASSAGVITISAHQRYYSDSNIVNVNSGSITGLTEGVFYRVTYQDSAREGGAVAYQVTTDDVSQAGSTHVTGGVTIPTAGSPDAGGAGVSPPGYVPDPDEDYR